MAAPISQPVPGETKAVSGSIIGKIADTFKLQEKTGPPVDTAVADLITGLVSTRLDVKRKVEIFDKHDRPDNCPRLKAPKVNNEIWRIMEPASRSQDVKAQKVQDIICKGLVPIAKVVNTLCTKDMNDIHIPDVVATLVDGVAVLAAANYELSMRRRDAIRFDLKPEYKVLCAHNTPLTENLFGDNVAEQIKDLSETNKMIGRVSQSNNVAPNYRFNPLKMTRGNFRPRGRGGRFLGVNQQSPQLPFHHNARGQP
ncbi:uncharacterized protein [Haliotis cracherodii]|uniref:uncharacterized protein n=1 Tax=Haliotis cracherodii TaxID=6455 RepID=UPI0039E8D2AB